MKRLPEKCRDEIDSFFDEFKEPVLAVCKSFGVKSKALKVARGRVGLAISALKIFFIGESLSLADQMFDLDFRFNQIDSSIFIYESTDSNFDFTHSIDRTQGARPIFITNLKLEDFSKRGLVKLSDYILNPIKGSLYIEITNGINHMGKILSNRILHDRIVELISFFERFIIPKDSSRGFGQTRLRDNVLPKIENPGKNFDCFVQLVNQFYNTRDRYLHNRVELPVNLHNLFSFQRLAILFLNHLIKLNTKHSELSEIHEYFGIRQ